MSVLFDRWGVCIHDMARPMTCHVCLPAGYFGGKARDAAVPWPRRVGRSRLFEKQGLHREGIHVDDEEPAGCNELLRRQTRSFDPLCL